MSLVEFCIYEGIKSYKDDDSYEIIFHENKFVFESNEFQFNINTNYCSLYVDRKTLKLMSNFYTEDFLESDFIQLVTGEKDNEGNCYVSSFVKTIKVNGETVFDISDYELYLNYEDGEEYVESCMSPKNNLKLDVTFQKWQYSNENGHTVIKL